MFCHCHLYTYQAFGFKFSLLSYGLPCIYTAAVIGFGLVHPHSSQNFLVCAALLPMGSHSCMHPLVPCFVQTTEHAQGLILFVVCVWIALFPSEWMTLYIWGRTWSARPPKYPQRWTANCHQAYCATQHPFHLSQQRRVQVSVPGEGLAADVHPQCRRSRN